MPASTSENRMAIRLLFVAVALVSVVLVLVRYRGREPYPGPFMPEFRYPALTRVSPTEAEMDFPRINVSFQEGLSEQVTVEALFPGVPGHVRGGLIRDLSAPPSKGEERVPPAVPVEIRRFLLHRLQALFPSRTPVAITVATERKTFRLRDYRETSSRLIAPRWTDLTNDSRFP